jgi:hypothetical protein
VVIAAAVVTGALAAPAAHADLIGGLLNNCPTGGSQVFAPWGDSANYLPAPNGGFESGAKGWSLSGGAAVVPGNQPFLRTGAYSLSLPSGSSAMSPTVCLGTKQLFIRLFAKDSGGSDHGLRVRVYWYGLLNKLLGVSDFATLPAGGDWGPSDRVNSGGGLLAPLPIVALISSTSARIEVTPLGGGSQWRIDDLYIDPYVSRIG